jgi:histidine ammonia-lyase
VSTVVLDGESLTPEDVVLVAREGAPVAVSDEARARVRASRERIEDVLAADEAVYGVNTGFGDLVTERIPRGELDDLQRNLVRSHASGAGEELDAEAVRALLVTRVNALLAGHSGIREVVVDHLVTMLNERVHPVVRSRGSLGASGDLAPLAHAALVLMGEGEATVGDAVDPVTGRARDSGRGGDRLPGDDALRAADLEPLELAPKEGLALINGTQLTVGLAALTVVDAEHVVGAADVAGALTTEVTMGTTASSDPAIHDARPHEGQAASARNVRRATADSEIVESHRNCDRVQDAYAIRCLPQVHGAVRDAVAHLRDAVETELNSATDNPLVFDADDVDDRASGTDSAAVLSGGNFHGAPLAHRLDYVVGALTDLAAVCERRVDRLLNPHLQEAHLPPYLAADSGLESGYMIAQYTAASLVNECRTLGRAATDNTPVSGGQEDHVSMSAQAAMHARTAVERATTVVGCELLCATEALRFVDDDLSPGAGTGAAADLVGETVPSLSPGAGGEHAGDRPLHRELDRVGELVVGGAVHDRVDGVLADDLE